MTPAETGAGHTYDSLNRLSTISSPNDPSGCTGLSWSYDAWGNRTAQTVTGGSCGPWSAGYNGANQITTLGFQYDAAGNLTYDGNHHYFYDAENRLIQVDGTFSNWPSNCSTATACYISDAEGRRVRKNAGANSYDYLYGLEGQVLARWDSVLGYTGWGAGYVYMNGQLLAVYSSGTTYFAMGDHLNSMRLLTTYSQTPSQNQQVASCDDYMPFGERLSYSTCLGSSPMFTGQERDGETGNDNFKARYYGSSMGRFLSPDPMGGHFMNPQSLNRYAYVHDNPLSMVDPTGMDCIYTQNLNDDGTVGYEQGDCSQPNGSFVNGSIDLSSLQIVQGNNGQYTLNFNYTDYDLGPGGLGQISLPGYSPMSSLGGGFGVGLGQPVGSLNSAATQIFSQVYQNARAVTNPANIALFYGASALFGGLGAGSAGLVSSAGVPTSIVEGIAPDPILDSLLQAGRSLGQNPGFLDLVSDIAQGYTPGAVPATLGGFIGAVASEIQSHWSTIATFVRANVPH